MELEKNKKRAERRKMKELKKQKSKKLYGSKKFGDHLANCSCKMCGNPRKYYKKRTVQELRFDINE